MWKHLDCEAEGGPFQTMRRRGRIARMRVISPSESEGIVLVRMGQR